MSDSRGVTINLGTKHLIALAAAGGIFVGVSTYSILHFLTTLRERNHNQETRVFIPSHAVMTKPAQACKKKKKPTRIYLDGCWDLMHSGHYNAIRQAKALGDILVAGVHSDAEITKNKRKPIMNNEQRMATVKACKWVDEVVFDVPYSPSVKLLDTINCDYGAHGDDMPTDVNGNNAYDPLKNAGRLKVFRRTPGVSTTTLIQRLVDAANDSELTTKAWSSFSATGNRISAFSNQKAPTKDDVVVYIDGVFDLFHFGQIAALKKAKECGTYLYVGLYDDAIISKKKGAHFPLMSLQERVLNILSCKYVDDVIIGCNWNVTEEMIQSLNISHFVTSENTAFCKDEFDRYDIAKKMGIYKELKMEVKYSTNDLIQRVMKSRNEIAEQNKNRVEKEKKYIEDYKYVEET